MAQMSTDPLEVAGMPPERPPQHARRAQVAPLLAAGLSERGDGERTRHSAECRVPGEAASREGGTDRAGPQAAASLEPPSSYVVRQTIDGIPHDVRHLTIEVYEHKVSKAIHRGLLAPDKRDDPGTVLSALFATCFIDDTLHWLCRRRVPHMGRSRPGRGDHRRGQ